jgi:hypothetical protein
MSETRLYPAEALGMVVRMNCWLLSSRSILWRTASAS